MQFAGKQRSRASKNGTAQNIGDCRWKQPGKVPFISRFSEERGRAGGKKSGTRARFRRTRFETALENRGNCPSPRERGFVLENLAEIHRACNNFRSWRDMWRARRRLSRHAAVISIRWPPYGRDIFSPPGAVISLLSSFSFFSFSSLPPRDNGQIIRSGI